MGSFSRITGLDSVFYPRWRNFHVRVIVSPRLPNTPRALAVAETTTGVHQQPQHWLVLDSCALRSQVTIITPPPDFSAKVFRAVAHEGT